MRHGQPQTRTLTRMIRFSFTAGLLLLLPALPVQAGMTISYTHTDVQGNVIAVTDQDQTVIERRQYEPYGLPQTPITDDTGYTGHLHDGGTELVYMQQRYYDPQIGQFLSVDPDGEFAGLAIKVVKVIAKGGDVAATMAGAIEDANTLMSADASLGDKLVAGASLASEIVSPISLRDAKAAGGVISSATKKACCFVAGTQVLTREGYKNIEDITLGEELWAKNTETGEQAWKPVTRVFVEPDRGIYEIVLTGDNGVTQTIEATDDHPFRVEGSGWKTTIELKPGDRIETDSDEPMTVVSVTDENRTDVTYNFTVADFHTYYVTERRVLVHNCNAPSSRAARRDAMRQQNDPTSRGSTEQRYNQESGQRQHVTQDSSGNQKVQTQHGADAQHSDPHWHNSEPKLDDNGATMDNRHGQIKYRNEGTTTSKYDD